METRANYTLVGTFVIVFTMAIIVFILWVSRIGFSHNVQEYDMYFSGSVTGLKEGGTVHYRGVPVGIVESIAIDPTNVEKIRVTVSIGGDVAIKEDTYASLEFQGITGISYIQLNGGTRRAPRLRPQPDTPRPVIPTRSSVFEEVSASLPTVLHQISKTFEEIRTLIDEDTRKAFSESLKHIHAITKDLAPGKEGDIREFVSGLKEGMHDIRSAAQELRDLLKENRPSIYNFTTTGLPALSQFLTEGKDTLEAIRRISDALERSPSRFLSNDPTQGVKVP